MKCRPLVQNHPEQHKTSGVLTWPMARLDKKRKPNDTVLNSLAGMQNIGSQDI